MGLIYMATNTVNGKKYIGQTTMDFTMRIYHHRWDKKKYLFGRAINKHGFDKFKWTVLKDGVLLQEELDRLEIELIAKYKTVTPYGYNLTHGGNGGRPCEETRQKIAANNKARAKAVICIETGIEYESVREVERQLGFNRSNITLACSRPSRKAKGYHWRYSDDARHAEIMARHEEKQRKEKEIIEAARIERQQKIVEARADRDNNEEHQRIRHEHYRAAVAKRYEVRRIARESTQEWKDAQIRKAKRTAEAQPKKVICIETREVFNSINSAAKIIGVNQTTMSEAVHIPWRKCKGNHYEILKEA